MYGKDLERFNALYGARNPLEDGHYFSTIDGFCELLIEACKEGENGTRYAELCQDLKERLPKDVFDTFFGFPTDEVEKWQPIATAPIDGTAILVYPPLWNDRTCSVAKYDDDSFAKKPRPFWRRDDAFGNVTFSRDKPPTHGMPMPRVPTEDKN